MARKKERRWGVGEVVLIIVHGGSLEGRGDGLMGGGRREGRGGGGGEGEGVCRVGLDAVSLPWLGGGASGDDAGRRVGGGEGVYLLSYMTVVLKRPSHLYNAGTAHVGFLLTMPGGGREGGRCASARRRRRCLRR